MVTEVELNWSIWLLIFCTSLFISWTVSFENKNLIGRQYLVEEGAGFCQITILVLDVV